MSVNSSDLSGSQLRLVYEAHGNHGVAILTDANAKRTAHSLARRGWGDVDRGAGNELIFRLNQSGQDEAVWLISIMGVIDTVSDAGSYADALVNSVNIKQADFN